MTAGLEGLPGVISVEHNAGTDRFVVRHEGRLDRTVEAVESVVLFKWARQWLEDLARWLRRERS